MSQTDVRMGLAGEKNVADSNGKSTIVSITRSIKGKSIIWCIVVLFGDIGNVSNW